ncbi:MAG: M24 family metallopeptidase, partial [Acidobacteriota bacterium]|nr:M24 family metallopeptidase [Acidobacteriota bacterium]
APDATYQILFQGKPINMPQYKLWFMHGLGHWLGMNVHDVGDYETPLQAGMIFTNEPGIYIREDALDYLPDTPENKAFLAKIRPAYEKYKNIGVRIEDDLLVTPTGVEWMTKALPRKINEIEAFMAQASKEMNYSRTRNIINPKFAVFDLNNLFQVEDSSWNPSLKTEVKSGKTIRRGWILSGRDAAFSGFQHLGHLHGE